MLTDRPTYQVLAAPIIEREAASEAEALRLAIEHDQAQLQDALDRLKSVVQERTDLGGYIAQKPYHVLIGALLLGLALGLRRR